MGEKAQKQVVACRETERKAKLNSGSPWAFKPKNPNAHLPPAATTNAPSVTPQRPNPVSTQRARHRARHGRSFRQAIPPFHSSIARTTTDHTPPLTSGTLHPEVECTWPRGNPPAAQLVKPPNPTILDRQCIHRSHTPSTTSGTLHSVVDGSARSLPVEPLQVIGGCRSR